MAASFAQILGNKRIGLMLPLGFASGLPLALTSGTLQAWLTVAGVDLKTIGIFTLVFLLIVDQWKFHGHYTREVARVARYVIAQVGL